MSDFRNKYSSAPLQNMKQARRKVGKAARNAPLTASDFQSTGAAASSFAVLQVMVMILLPLFFVVTLIARNNMMFLIFSLLSVLCMMAMWLFNAFLPTARATISIFHIAMVLIALFAVLISPPADIARDDTPTQDLSAIFAKDSSANLSDVLVQKSSDPAAPAETPNPGQASFAQKRLDQFMSAWVSQDYTAMVACCLPSWVDSQENAERSMFHIRANRSPVSYQINSISGSDLDNSRTVDLDVVIDKSNGSTPLTYRFQVLMMRINDEWFIDPHSLTSSTMISELSTRVPIATIVPTNTPPPDTLLYYNPDGGSLYHVDPECKSVHSKYLPLKGQFYYRDLSQDQFRKLNPCGSCHAPGRSK